MCLTVVFGDDSSERTETIEIGAQGCARPVVSLRDPLASEDWATVGDLGDRVTYRGECGWVVGRPVVAMLVYVLTVGVAAGPYLHQVAGGDAYLRACAVVIEWCERAVREQRDGVVGDRGDCAVGIWADDRSIADVVDS